MTEDTGPNKTLKSVLHRNAETALRPDGRSYQRLSINAVHAIADSQGIDPLAVEMAAIGEDIIPERYSRNNDALSRRDQLRLLASTAAIVGMGGLGGTVGEILARAGVGRLILIDGDEFENSNLNRQLNCTTANIGAAKAPAAATRIGIVNPSTQTVVRKAVMTVDNAAAVIQGADVAVDCLDSLPARFALEGAARTLGIPMVTAAVAGTTGQVSVIVPGGTDLTKIYGDPAETPEKGVETTTGNLPQTVWAVAAIEAAEVIKTLLGRTTLAGRLLILDLDEPVFEIIDLT